MDTTLLVTKLYIPQQRARLVSREHLLEKLQEGLQTGCRLTLLAAPAGGKTTLIAAWMRDQNRRLPG
jgi:LuxR family maltose regulon positive regulatory protein